MRYGEFVQNIGYRNNFVWQNQLTEKFLVMVVSNNYGLFQNTAFKKGCYRTYFIWEIIVKQLLFNKVRYRKKKIVIEQLFCVRCCYQTTFLYKKFISNNSSSEKIVIDNIQKDNLVIEDIFHTKIGYRTTFLNNNRLLTNNTY